MPMSQPVIVIARYLVPVPPRLSVTLIAMAIGVAVAVVGVPLMTPVEEPSDSPSGRAPVVIDQVV